MKKLLLLIFIGFAFLSCDDKKSNLTPSGVTEAFVKAFNTADFQNMYNYSSKKSHILIDNLAEQRTEKEFEVIRGRKIAIDSTVISQQTDSTATCICYFRVKELNNKDNWMIARQEWSLAKESGDWKVLLVRP